MNKLWMVAVLLLAGCNGAQAHPQGPVLLLGDSLKEGYATYVHEQLPCVETTSKRGWPDKSNDRDTGNYLLHMDEWLDGKHFGIIHFNAGMWDIARLAPTPNNPWALDATYQAPRRTSPAQYRHNLEKIVDRLQQTGAILIFATTTDVPDGSTGRLQKDADQYNAIAISVMQERGIEIDDLAGWMRGQDLMHLDQNGNKVHYNDAGRKLMAEKVMQVLRDHAACN